MITGVKGEGTKETAECSCDFCGTSVRMAARLGHTHDEVENLDTIYKKLQRDGWSNISKKLRCPSCEKERKSKQTTETKMNKTLSVPRQPTKEQKREIIDMLGVAYDTVAQRYKGNDTDKTVAEAIGQHILWGWVAQLRDEFFGPAGNEAATQTLAEIKEWQEKANAVAKKMHSDIENLQKNLREFNSLRDEVTKLEKKVGDLNE